MNAKIDLNLILLGFLSILFLGLNSIFCKIALVNSYADAYTFTLLRLIFATITLMLIYIIKHKDIKIELKKNWFSGFALFLYAISFSYSYLSLDAGFGTLLLFAVVQITMLSVAIFFKEKFNIYKIIGVNTAFAGLIYLLYPKQEFSVDLFYAFLMIIAGLAWAIYSIFGKSSGKDNMALFNTMDNFIKATIFAIIFLVFIDINLSFVTYEGVLYAFLSGSITSGLGYLMWYSLLPKMQINTAGILQLLVPLISIVLSVIFLDEVLTQTLIISSILVCFGVLMTFKKVKEKIL